LLFAFSADVAVLVTAQLLGGIGAAAVTVLTAGLMSTAIVLAEGVRHYALNIERTMPDEYTPWPNRPGCPDRPAIPAS
jgi:hypothetical protein